MQTILEIVLCLLPILVLGFILNLMHSDAVVGRNPLCDGLLRAPGESLQLRVQSLDDRLLVELMIFAGLSSLWGLAFIESQSRPSPLPWRYTWPVLLLLLVVCFGIRLFRLARDRRHYAQGLHGERAVGEELNRLMLEGCRVFHDLPAGANWNIDHVVVGPPGVFAVETKTRRKRRGGPRQKDYRVVYDGRRLTFPRGTDRGALDQARRNARWLGRFLSSATGHAVRVQPILTLPGWFIDRRKPGPVTVVNHKELPSAIRRHPARRLSPAEIQSIAHQLDRKCRMNGPTDESSAREWITPLSK